MVFPAADRCQERETAAKKSGQPNHRSGRLYKISKDDSPFGPIKTSRHQKYSARPSAAISATWIKTWEGGFPHLRKIVRLPESGKGVYDTHFIPLHQDELLKEDGHRLLPYNILTSTEM
jgi:hypothetical protein